MTEITSSSERFLLRAAPVAAGALPAETINSLPPTAIQDGQTEFTNHRQSVQTDRRTCQIPPVL